MSETPGASAHRASFDRCSTHTLRHTLNFQCLSGGVVNFHQNALQQRALLGHVKSLRTAGQKAPYHRLDLPAQNAFVRAGESGIGQVRRATRENLLVRRLDVGVRAHHRADSSIEHSPESDLPEVASA